MRNYDVKFTEEGVQTFRYKSTEFSNLRTFILVSKNPLTKACVYCLVDALDEVKDMKVGDTLYFVSSEFSTYYTDNLDNLNSWTLRASAWSREDKEFGEKTIPCIFSAFNVKRTIKGWTLKLLNYEVIH